MSRRVFVAIPAPSDLRAAAAEWMARHERLPVRWIDERDLHVTLIPPWYEVVPERVIEALKIAVGTGELDLEFTRVRLGPDPADPRLIWAEGEPPVALLNLKVTIEKALGVRITLRRPFHLHLTLARFRPGDLASFPSRSLDEPVLWRARATTVALMESHLSPHGAEYDILEEIRLRA